MTEKNILDIVKKSAFNKQKYEVNIPFKRFISSLMEYIDEDIKEQKFENILKYGIPGFQRDNDKWSREMQIAFVENIIKGLRTKIQLFLLEEDYQKFNFMHCKIIDGLQRTTAICEFIEGKFKIFDNSFSYNDLIEKTTLLKGIGINFSLEIFRFDTIEDAIDFYVEMNKNITHSEEDIKKALSFKSNQKKSKRTKLKNRQI